MSNFCTAVFIYLIRALHMFMYIYVDNIFMMDKLSSIALLCTHLVSQHVVFRSIFTKICLFLASRI